MASFIDPSCAVPIYLMENSEVARQCGKLSGYFVAGMVTIVAIIAAISMYINRNKYYDEQNRHSSKRVIKYLLLTSLVVGLSWVSLPFIISWFNTIEWRGYNKQYESYRAKGLTTNEAVKQIQSMAETRLQANAISSGASTIANALRGNKRF